MTMEDQRAMPAWWRELKKVPRLRTQFKEMGFNRGNMIETKKMRDFLANVADWAVECGIIEEDPLCFGQSLTVGPSERS